MLPKELLKKVRKIQLKMTRLSDEAMAGHYASVFKGMGMEFAEVREYVAGDDVRAIDWNVTARSGSPYVKRYMEEREMTLVLVVDLSASQRFGTVNSLKSELAAEISALLAFLAIKNNDKVVNVTSRPKKDGAMSCGWCGKFWLISREGRGLGSPRP